MKSTKAKLKVAITLGLMLTGTAFGQQPVLVDDGPVPEAVYDLPPHESYAGFSRFEMEVTRYEVHDETYFFEYLLPEDLVGRSGETMLMIGQKEEDAPFLDLFCGATGTAARCTLADEAMACTILFGDLSLDHEQVTDFIQSKYPEDLNLEKRLAAAAIFERDAIGTMLVRIPSRP